jgi:predicted nucleic acid-binding protein
VANRTVVDASAIVDALLETALGVRVAKVLEGSSEVHSPAHMDAEVLSALGRLERGGKTTAAAVAGSLESLERAPIQRHAVAGLLVSAWSLRHRFRLVDALYVELAQRLRADLITTDRRLAAAAGVEPITA